MLKTLLIGLAVMSAKLAIYGTLTTTVCIAFGVSPAFVPMVGIAIYLAL